MAKGVEIHRGKIRLSFQFRAKRIREPLNIDATPANIKYATRLRANLVTEINAGVFDYKKYFPDTDNVDFYRGGTASMPTIAELLEDFLKIVAPTLKASTLAGYRKIANNVLAVNFGHISVDEFKRRQVTAWASNQAASGKRIANVVSVLRAALDYAVDEEYIDKNPLHRWKYRKQAAPARRPAVDPFTAKEQAAIINAAPAGQGRNMLLFWFWSGLRTSELIALEWSDIDYIEGQVHINKARTADADEAELPKTTAGQRFIKLLPPAIEALERQKEHTYLTGGVIFLNPRTGQPWAGDAPIRRTLWTHALKRAGVRYRRPYQCRHTYASMMLSAGESVMWVAKQMGHSDWTQTARAYARWIDDAASSEGSAAVAKFWGQVSEAPEPGRLMSNKESAAAWVRVLESKTNIKQAKGVKEK